MGDGWNIPVGVQESPSSEKHVLKSGFHVMGFDQCFQIDLVFVICLWVQVS